MGHKYMNMLRVKRLTALLLAFFMIFWATSPVFAAGTAEALRSQVATNQGASDPQNSEPSSSDPSTLPADEITTDPDPQPQSLMVGSEGDINSFNVASSIEQRLTEVDQNSGGYSYDYPLTVPPGRNGLNPSLKLSYNNQNNEDVNLYGYGWSDNIPFVVRLNKKGTDQLFSQNYFYSSLSGELIDLGSGSYGSKIDNGEFLTYSLSSSVWTVTDKKGTVYKFGTNASERQDDPSDSTKVYKWMLQRIPGEHSESCCCRF
ncbi:MAG: hypothetical protein KW802_01265 [Candidatus Doudnabacteria bacterium]|nr:hypothetical protein [Candidatus Doudnabacteria bacterium]